MLIITDPQELQQTCLQLRNKGKSIALVPTMGYFHKGHESLIAKGRELADVLIVTIFVNPTQFAPHEDLDAYPNDLENDLERCRALGADLVFAPKTDSMYGKDHATWVEVPSLARGLCGASRPIHFRGVCTVVAKLFNLTVPTVAVFGEKDWQQLAIIRQMVKDLNFPVQIAGMPIVREADGLAMSSRNAYMTQEERAQAPQFNKGMSIAKDLIAAGERDAAAICEAIRQDWKENIPLGREDYLFCVDPVTLEPQETLTKTVLIAAAMHVGKARILDNLYIEIPSEQA